MHYSVVYKHLDLLRNTHNEFAHSWFHFCSCFFPGKFYALVFLLSFHVTFSKFEGNGFCGRHNKRIWNVSGTSTNAHESTAGLYETSKRSNGWSHTQQYVSHLSCMLRHFTVELWKFFIVDKMESIFGRNKSKLNELLIFPSKLAFEDTISLKTCIITS